MSAIAERRSIRKFKQEAVSREQLSEIIRAGILAPSAKNRQPWRFVVVTGKSKEAALNAMERGLQRESAMLAQSISGEETLSPETQDRFFSGNHSAIFLRDAENTLKIMRQAPAVIFIMNALGADLRKPLSVAERVHEICNAQSIGAAIENMSLAAVELGLGSLWICNTFFAFDELTESLHTDGVLYAALAVGYPDEQPLPRPRKSIEAVTEWRD